MAEGRMNAQSLSGRQLCVAVFVAGLSPAAALAGTADWRWLAVWSGAGILLSRFVLWRIGTRPVCRGVGGGILYIMYAGWAVFLASRALGRAASRLELTSGGSPRFWLVLISAVPLLWISSGKAAPFFRLAEILWPAMAAVLVPVLVFGLARTQWGYVMEGQLDWRQAALAAGEIFAPALFVLPYIYKAQGHSAGRGVGWLSILGAASTGLSLITAGILGRAAQQVPHAFYVAAGTLGKSARCEGLLSALWLLPDLMLAGLLCRVWGGRGRPLMAAALTAALTILGIGEAVPQEICVFGALVLLALSLLLPGGKGKIVVEF